MFMWWMSLVIVVTFQCNFISADVQSIKLCNTLNCDDKEEVFRSSVRNFNQVSKLLKDGEKIVIYCTQKPSLWTVYKNPDYEEDTDEVDGNLLGGSTTNCESGRGGIGSFRHIGNIETHKSGLSLYTKKYFQGRELYFVGDILKLPSPLHVKSFGFTGLDRWEFYTTPELTGKSTCVKQAHADQIAWAFNENEVSRLVRGKDVFSGLSSIQRGCLHEERKKDVHPPNPIYDPNLKTTPKLSLFEGANRGGAKLYMEGYELRLPYAQNFSSFEANGTWQTFTGRDFDGNTTCLNIFHDKNFDNEGIQVGSIKLGCGHPVNELEEEEDSEESSSIGSKVFSVFHFMSFLLFFGFSQL